MSRHVTAKFDADADADFADEYNLGQNSGMFNIRMRIFVINSITMMRYCGQVLICQVWPLDTHFHQTVNILIQNLNANFYTQATPLISLF